MVDQITFDNFLSDINQKRADLQQVVQFIMGVVGGGDTSKNNQTGSNAPPTQGSQARNIKDSQKHADRNAKTLEKTMREGSKVMVAVLEKIKSSQGNNEKQQISQLKRVEKLLNASDEKFDKRYENNITEINRLQKTMNDINNTLKTDATLTVDTKERLENKLTEIKDELKKRHLFKLELEQLKIAREGLKAQQDLVKIQKENMQYLLGPIHDISQYMKVNVESYFNLNTSINRLTGAIEKMANSFLRSRADAQMYDRDRSAFQFEVDALAYQISTDVIKQTEKQNAKLLLAEGGRGHMLDRFDRLYDDGIKTMYASRDEAFKGINEATSMLLNLGIRPTDATMKEYLKSINYAAGVSEMGNDEMQKLVQELMNSEATQSALISATAEQRQAILSNKIAFIQQQKLQGLTTEQMKLLHDELEKTRTGPAKERYKNAVKMQAYMSMHGIAGGEDIARIMMKTNRSKEETDRLAAVQKQIGNMAAGIIASADATGNIGSMFLEEAVSSKLLGKETMSELAKFSTNISDVGRAHEEYGDQLSVLAERTQNVSDSMLDLGTSLQQRAGSIMSNPLVAGATGAAGVLGMRYLFDRAGAGKGGDKKGGMLSRIFGAAKDASPLDKAAPNASRLANLGGKLSTIGRTALMGARLFTPIGLASTLALGAYSAYSQYQQNKAAADPTGFSGAAAHQKLSDINTNGARAAAATESVASLTKTLVSHVGIIKDSVMAATAKNYLAVGAPNTPPRS